MAKVDGRKLNARYSSHWEKPRNTQVVGDKQRERVILGGATQTSRKKHMLDEDGKTVLEVALGNKEHADLSLLREDSDGVSTLIKENQI